MGGRYWLTGVQLALISLAKTNKDREKILKEIEDNQFIGNFRTEEEKKSFIEKVGKLFKSSG